MTDVQLPWCVAALLALPGFVKERIADRPLAWRYYTSICRRAGWDARCLGWHTPANGPFAGIRTQALHTNHLWVAAGVYEPVVTRCVVGLMREILARRGRANVWDVGAHHGRFSLLCAKHGAARVLAIEPSAVNMSMLRDHLSANPALRDAVEVLHAAIANVDGTGEFLVDANDGAICQIRAMGVVPYERERDPLATNVTCWRLDSLAELRGTAPDLVKIDVEGAEALVLEGAAELLAREQPVLLIEVHNAEAGTACVSRLHFAGYRVERIARGGRLVPVTGALTYGHIVARHRDWRS